MGSDHPPTKSKGWMPVVVAGLLGWNLVVTGLYLDAGAVRAEAPSCASLRTEVTGLKRQLGARDAAIAKLTERLRRMARGNIRSIERALSGTGIVVDRLIRRGRSDNQGGPFIPVGSLGAAAHDVERWESLRRVMRVLPLGSPIHADYEISSGFGARRDPLNGRRAMHQGLDLKAPLRTPIHATGPGTVAFAGYKGRYGRMVEVDHGLGVMTRYAHLAAIHVKRGQAVREGSRIGLLGNSGRTSGPHLHYEVVVDGVANNPHRFIRAGIRLGGRWGD